MTISTVGPVGYPALMPEESEVGQRRDVTLLLRQIAQGDNAANEELLALVYDDLRAIARGKVPSSGAGRRSRPPTWCTSPGCG